jgi:AraC family transcriptional regulator of adaptative response/methylated-DNA-[protein]-cysteine methyltransferase
MNQLPTTKQMQRAWMERDASYDGLFFIGVRTTSIFCRPVCSARKPMPQNVEYFQSAREAMVAGYRPCKRCRPLDLDDQPQWASDLMAEIEHNPSGRLTEDFLKARGVDPSTVRRHFQKRFGMTFHAFARANRLSGALQKIREGGSIDDAVFESGYESHSGFRSAVSKLAEGKRGVRGATATESVLLKWIRSPLGPLVAGATDKGVCLLEFTDRRSCENQFNAVKRRIGGSLVPGSNAHLTLLERELNAYFSGSLREFKTPLLYPGTEFQKRVWTRLLRIPYGKTMFYEQMAEEIGSPAAVRAVGRANGMNRIAILIPCHRVVAKDGTLCGYGGGLARKQFLLDLERSKQ